MLRRIIICIFLGAITVLGVNLQYFLRHPEEKLFGSTGEIIFSVFACPAFAVVFLVIWLSFFSDKKSNNNAKEDEKDTDDDDEKIENGVYADEDKGIKRHDEGDHCYGCPDGEIESVDRIFCEDQVHCPGCDQSKLHMS